MREHQWNRSQYPKEMFRYVIERNTEGKFLSNRKLRLLACAICRDAWGGLHDDRLREAVEIGERFADGACTIRQRQEVWGGAHKANDPDNGGYTDLSVLASVCAAGDPTMQELHRWLAGECPNQASIVREIFGSPFRLYSLKKLWPSRAIRTEEYEQCKAMLLSAYKERDRGFLCQDRLLILADLLEDLQVHEDLRVHLRQDRPHFRGCWVLDLLRQSLLLNKDGVFLCPQHTLFGGTYEYFTNEEMIHWSEVYE